MSPSSEMISCRFCVSRQPKETYLQDGRPRYRCASCGCPEPETNVQTVSDLFTAPRVLFIDDDPLVRVLLQTAVPALEFEVITAASGPAGIALARQESPDAIVVDVLMPHMSGFEVCRQLRADPTFRTIPIVLMSAREDPGLAQKGRAAGATCTVSKPGGVEEMAQVLRQALAHPPQEDPVLGNIHVGR